MFGDPMDFGVPLGLPPGTQGTRAKAPKEFQVDSGQLPWCLSAANEADGFFVLLSVDEQPHKPAGLNGSHLLLIRGV